MQVSNDHGDLHTSLLMLLNIPKTSGGKWVKGQSQRQRVPKTLGLGKDSKQARISLRVMGPSQEVHKGPPTMYARGQQSCELGREGSTWGSCSTGRPDKARQALCSAARQALLSTKNMGLQDKRAVSEEHMCMDSQEKLQRISKRILQLHGVLQGVKCCAMHVSVPFLRAMSFPTYREVKNDEQ